MALKDPVCDLEPVGVNVGVSLALADLVALIEMDAVAVPVGVDVCRVAASGG